MINKITFFLFFRSALIPLFLFRINRMPSEDRTYSSNIVTKESKIGLVLLHGMNMDNTQCANIEKALNRHYKNKMRPLQ